MARVRTRVILATSAATYLHARTICIITSSSSAVSCRDSTVPIARTGPNTRRTWGPTYAGYTLISESMSSTCASSKTVNWQWDTNVTSFANFFLFNERKSFLNKEVVRCNIEMMVISINWVMKRCSVHCYKYIYLYYLNYLWYTKRK